MLYLYSHVIRSLFDVKKLLHYTNNPTMSIFRLSLRRCFDSYVAKLQRFGDVKLCSALCCIVTLSWTKWEATSNVCSDLSFLSQKSLFLLVTHRIRESFCPSGGWSVKWSIGPTFFRQETFWIHLCCAWLFRLHLRLSSLTFFTWALLVITSVKLSLPG